MSQAAGWYVDPGSARHLRYWDGVRWTNFVVEAPPPAPAARSRAGQHVAAVAGIVVLALILFGSLIALVDGGDGEATASDPPSAPVDDASANQVKPAKKEKPKPQKTGMPAVTGISVTKARGKLQRADLGKVRITRKVSTAPPGTVLRQSSRAGKALALGTAVTLVVSAPWPRVPGVRGMYAGAAVSRLRQAGFHVITTQRTTTSGRDGVVLSQSPLGLKTIKPHSTVRVVVADLHKPAPPPANNCTTGYRPCLAPAPDYDCAGGSGDGPKYANGPIYVTGSDPYGLDAEGDGIACES